MNFSGINQLIPHLKKSDFKLHLALGQISDSLVSVTNQLNNLATPANSTGGSVIIFSIPGVFGIQSDAAPLAISPTNITWSSVIAVVKQAPVGASISMTLKFAGAAVANFSITDGNTQVTDNITATSNAGDIITIDVTSVGTTFPGSDLTIQLQS